MSDGGERSPHQMTPGVDVVRNAWDAARGVSYVRRGQGRRHHRQPFTGSSVGSARRGGCAQSTGNPRFAHAAHPSQTQPTQAIRGGAARLPTLGAGDETIARHCHNAHHCGPRPCLATAASSSVSREKPHHRSAVDRRASRPRPSLRVAQNAGHHQRPGPAALQAGQRRRPCRYRRQRQRREFARPAVEAYFSRRGPRPDRCIASEPAACRRRLPT
jgi:hypothetical protein